MCKKKMELEGGVIKNLTSISREGGGSLNNFVSDRGVIKLLTTAIDIFETPPLLKKMTAPLVFTRL